MLFKKIALLAIVSACVCLGAATANAASFLTDETATAPSSITSTSSDPVTLTFAGLGTITCTRMTFSADVGAGGGTTIAGTLTAFGFDGCTDTIPVINYSTCSLHGPMPTVTLTATGASGGTVTLSPTFVFCPISGSSSGCYFQLPDATGTFTNTTHALAFTNVAMTHSVPTGTTNDLGSLCGSGVTMSGTLTQLVNAANDSPLTLSTTA
jgi:hypothetical protein